MQEAFLVVCRLIELIIHEKHWEKTNGNLLHFEWIGRAIFTEKSIYGTLQWAGCAMLLKVFVKKWERLEELHSIEQFIFELG